jgi:hypothetical protein
MTTEPAVLNITPFPLVWNPFILSKHRNPIILLCCIVLYVPSDKSRVFVKILAALVYYYKKASETVLYVGRMHVRTCQQYVAVEYCEKVSLLNEVE